MKLPWSHAIASRVESHGPRTTYPDTVKYVRNRLRPYGAESIVRMALKLLHSGKPRTQEQLQTWPWITCLLVKLVLEDPSIPLNGADCPPQIFDRCREALWEVQAGSDRFDDHHGGLYLMLRSMVQAQLFFQSKASWDFLRFPALVRRLPANHPTRQLFNQQFGMDATTFICLCYAGMAMVVGGVRHFNLRIFARLNSAFGGANERFVDLFARDLQGLRQELQEELQVRLSNGRDRRPSSEYNEFPWLLNFPLLRRGGEIIVWHPSVFERGIEEAVHRRLSLRREEYAKNFSKVFEDHVVEVLKSGGKTYVGEDEYKRRYGRDKKSVEAILTEDRVNILIESKMTAYSRDVTASERAPVVWRGLKRVREAMDQGWTVGSALRSGAFAGLPCSTAEEDFLIVVTSQQMMCATGEHFRRLFKPEIFEPEAQLQRAARAATPNGQQLQLLPLKNVVIASISEFERLMSAVGSGELDLLDFLREVAQANQDPASSVMFLDQMLKRHVTKVRLPQVMAEALDEAKTILKLVFGED